MSASELQSYKSRVQVKIERRYKDGTVAIIPMSLPHGIAFYTTPIRSIKKTLLCPAWLNCKWCASVVERAHSLASADIEVYF